MYEIFVSIYKEVNLNIEIMELDLFVLDFFYYGNIVILGGYKCS